MQTSGCSCRRRSDGTAAAGSSKRSAHGTHANRGTLEVPCRRHVTCWIGLLAARSVNYSPPVQPCPHWGPSGEQGSIRSGLARVQGRTPRFLRREDLAKPDNTLSIPAPNSPAPRNLRPSHPKCLRAWRSHLQLPGSLTPRPSVSYPAQAAAPRRPAALAAHAGQGALAPLQFVPPGERCPRAPAPAVASSHGFRSGPAPAPAVAPPRVVAVRRSVASARGVPSLSPLRR